MGYGRGGEVGALLGAVLVAGCATTSGTATGSSPFTTAEELKRLTSGKRPEKVFTTRAADVTQWALLGPFPTELRLAPHEQESATGKFIVAEASKRGAMTTAALACAARELAAFVASQREQPPSLLKDAIAGRCAVGTMGIRSWWIEGETGDATDDELLASMAPGLVAGLAKVGRSTALGAALARSGTRGVLMVVQAEPVGTLEPVSLLPVDGAVTLRGTAPPDVVELAAVVTRGELGASTCVDLHLRPLPAFDLRCPIQGSDESAWISVATRSQGRLLTQELRRLLVWPAGRPSTQWALPQVVPPGTAPTVEAISGQVNALRASAGLKPLVLSAAQSADLHEVAPFLFQAVVTGDTAAADQLALGIIAGWHVEKDLTSGNFTAEVSERDDGSLLLTHALLSPSARVMLLDPSMSELGVGLYREAGMVGGVFSVYRALERPAFPAAVEAVVKRLDAARAKVSRGPVKWLRLLANDEKDLAEALGARRLEVSEALSTFLQNTVTVVGRGARGFSVETTSLEEIDWPAEVLNAEQLEVAVVASSTRRPRAAWSHFVVLLALPEPQ